ncbi:N-acetylmuramoyl-L-alanine amidase [Loktanella sp. F6476L]|uniref:N-acetylmuramoyl-L-alanine amidase n=1 Tax=Loktanella sp. F6476L TaxID=2926405 RepID=UPI001FF578D3|nr:N-acetylmuramoyl-L-alanine amidase [Loktanella sp. F6476L]MCK0122441.1 N-acetylmuramoyl-L-alanine amidase [Loktanella sp. F6476L]
MSDIVGRCSRLWSKMKDVAQTLPPLFPEPPAPRRDAPDLGHEGGVDEDVQTGTSEAQEAGQAADEAGGDADTTETTGSCPLCKVAIVVGHNSRAQGASSPHVGESEFPYNSDIAERTVAKIAELGGGKITAQVFFRTAGGGYTTEMRRCYEPVTAFLEGVPSNKKIALELHYNSVDSPSASYTLTIYKGDRAFATAITAAMSEIYGGTRQLVKSHTENARGKATFTYGPSNTYLMEPFFGSHERTGKIAGTEAGRDALAQVYAQALVDWVG